MRPSVFSSIERPTVAHQLAAVAIALVLALVAMLGAATPLTGSGTALGGQGWSEPIPIAEGTQTWDLHDIAVAGDTIHLVYVRMLPDVLTQGALYYRRSDDGGRHWTPEQLLFRSGARFVHLVPNMAIAAEGRDVVVAFRSREGADAILFARASQDGGRTWGPRRELARVATDLRMGIPSAAASPAGLFVAWSERDTGAIRLVRSIDGGRSFGPALRLGISRFSFGCGPAYRDGMVGLAAAHDTVLAAWTDVDPGGATNDCQGSRIVARRSFDGGATFDAKRLVYDEDTGGWPEIVANGRDTLITLQSMTDGRSIVLRSDDALATVSARTLTSLGQPDVALRPNGDAILAYSVGEYDENGLPAWARVVVRRSGDAGATWTPAVAAIPRGAYGAIGAVNVAYIGAHPVVVTGWLSVGGADSGIVAVVGPAGGGR